MRLLKGLDAPKLPDVTLHQLSRGGKDLSRRPRKARSAGEPQRLSFQAIRVPTRSGSFHLSSDRPPAASSVSTLTAGKTETPIPALTHRFMASMLWNSSVSLDTTSTSESCRSTPQTVNVSDKVVRPRVLPLAGLLFETVILAFPCSQGG